MTCPRCQKSFQKTGRTKNRLWLLIVPPLFPLALISSIKPSGPFAFWTEISIFCLSSLLCGFALAMKQFDTVKHRLLGAMAYSMAGMYLICCMSFLGCSILFEMPPPPVQNQQAQEIQRRAWTDQKTFTRDALADPSMLDLSLYYDGIVPDPARYPNPLYVAQHPGTHIWDGIKFDVRGTTGGWILETNTVAVGRRCSEVYSLHGAHARIRWTLVNQFFIHFQDGRTVTIPVSWGTDLSNEHFANGVVPTNAVVWEQIISTNGTPRPFLGFFIKKWMNPFPDEPIASIGFAPRRSAYLVAITIKPTMNSSP